MSSPQVCIQRMSFLFGPHLFLAAISFSLYTFAFCHSRYKYKYKYRES